MSAIDGTSAAVDQAIADLTRSERHAEAALVTAGALIVRNQFEDAVRTLDRLLSSSATGPAGWIIPIDPMLASIRAPLEKSGLFAKLAARAA